MAENSNIAWTTHTFNPWVGCTKVSPGCDACYAEAWDRRFGGGGHWGPGAARRRTTVQNWNKPLRWQRDRRAALDRGEAPAPVRVFCASLADVFDNEVPQSWRDDLWALIEACPDLFWILVTKRVGNVKRMVGFLPANVIVLATIVDQKEADRDCDKLLDLVSEGIVQKVGVSNEPALGSIDWMRWVYSFAEHEDDIGSPSLDWIIIGGESAQGSTKARPFDVAWARSTIEQCRNAHVPVFVKQMGSNPIGVMLPEPMVHLIPPVLEDRAGADPDEWPEDLRVREFPHA